MVNMDQREIWKILDTVMDPEIPVVSLVELGVIREVEVDETSRSVRISLTPTFSACPAFQQMQVDIEDRLRQAGVERIELVVKLAPPWSSDWISPEARQKLKAFGLAPAPLHGGILSPGLLDVIACPFCDSTDTVMKNSFGPTLCRAIFYCNQCQQPFEQFKPL